MSVYQIKGLRSEVRGFRQIIQNLRVGEALASYIRATKVAPTHVIFYGFYSRRGISFKI